MSDYEESLKAIIDAKDKIIENQQKQIELLQLKLKEKMDVYGSKIKAASRPGSANLNQDGHAAQHYAGGYQGVKRPNRRRGGEAQKL